MVRPRLARAVLFVGAHGLVINGSPGEQLEERVGSISAPRQVDERVLGFELGKVLGHLAKFFLRVMDEVDAAVATVFTISRVVLREKAGLPPSTMRICLLLG